MVSLSAAFVVRCDDALRGKISRHWGCEEKERLMQK